MNLKKNDKIILIIGVVILVVAGAGIALYDSDANDSGIAEDMDYQTYSYTWIELTDEKPFDGDLYAGKKTPYEGVHTVSSKANTVLANVEILIEWEDDNTYGLLREKGLDLLSAEIATSGGSPSIKDFVGNGSDSFFFSINSRPPSDSIEAHSAQDAKDIIEDEISGTNTASFDVVVSVSIGEKMFRPLKFFKDKGNDFSLTARYTYYSYELETGDNDPNDGSDDDEDIKDTGDSEYGHNVGNFYVNLGYGRGMI
ncbi:hypothetical protein B6U98_00140 [Thermoplasmatales archaeon ex4572_165]|nr:MAG: hypothetical protein B6U98_00140 [Thermoplasmatales archaeon ex4572_165]RLF58636.1 MAG: hypothetical protein DRN27_04840 [Thermoplasmata archaeon]